MGSRKIKIFILGKDNVDWSIDKDRENIIYFLKENGFQITKNVFKANLIFCVWADLLLNFKYFWLKFLKKVFRKKFVAVITNDITFAQEKVKPLRQIVDNFVAPSEKIYHFLKEKGFRVSKIPLFINPSIFKPLNLSKEEICKKLKLDYEKIKNKVVISSFQRDSLGNNLLKPKWQKNPDLLIEILKKLPKEKFVFLLAGPRRHYIIKRCLEEKINFLFFGDYSYLKTSKDDIMVNNLPLEKINYLYNLSDIYLITSKSEGGPKQVIESALSKTLIFATKVGFASDFLHPTLLFEGEEIQPLIRKIIKFISRPEEFKIYIEYNFQKAKTEMAPISLQEKYKKLILETYYENPYFI